MHVFRRSSKIQTILTDEDIQDVQFAINDAGRLCIRIVKNEKEDLMIVLTNLQTRKLIYFLEKAKNAVW